MLHANPTGERRARQQGQSFHLIGQCLLRFCVLGALALEHEQADDKLKIIGVPMVGFTKQQIVFGSQSAIGMEGPVESSGYVVHCVGQEDWLASR